jgi:hypothetical protein
MVIKPGEVLAKVRHPHTLETVHIIATLDDPILTILQTLSSPPFSQGEAALLLRSYRQSLASGDPTPESSLAISIPERSTT